MVDRSFLFRQHKKTTRKRDWRWWTANDRPKSSVISFLFSMCFLFPVPVFLSGRFFFLFPLSWKTLMSQPSLTPSFIHFSRLETFSFHSVHFSRSIDSYVLSVSSSSFHFFSSSSSSSSLNQKQGSKGNLSKWTSHAEGHKSDVFEATADIVFHASRRFDAMEQQQPNY